MYHSEVRPRQVSHEIFNAYSCLYVKLGQTQTVFTLCILEISAVVEKVIEVNVHVPSKLSLVLFDTTSSVGEIETPPTHLTIFVHA